MTEVLKPMSVRQEVDAILGADYVSFRPCAYYDHHMDCIRIELRDCSVKELRVSELLTVHLDNHANLEQTPVVGLTIKGIKHLFTGLKLPLDGIVQITQILDALAHPLEQAIQEAYATMRNETFLAHAAVSEVKTFARKHELKVDMNIALMAA